MRVIRLKTNHNIIKAYGLTKAGGLGSYDESLFEEVELNELPPNFEIYKEIVYTSGKELIEYIDLNTKNMTDLEAYNLVSRLTPVVLYLQQERCNLLTLDQFNRAKTQMNSLLSTSSWAKTRKTLNILLVDFEKTRNFYK